MSSEEQLPLQQQLAEQREKLKLYESLLKAELDPEKRDSYLAELANAKEEIRQLEARLAEENARSDLSLPTTPLQRTPSSVPPVRTSVTPAVSLVIPGVILSDVYNLEQLLGRGGMGEVWLATHLLLNEPRAIKIISAAGESSTKIRERFIQGEARNALRLHHPNIVRVYELNQFQNTPYIVMEFVKGGSQGTELKAILKAQRKLSLTVVEEILKQVSAGLMQAHSQGLVHRDLKPSNLLVTAEGQVKISDFGLVKDLQTESDLTNSNLALGTPMYMAPEQAEGHSEIRSDIYSLGIILYELLSGRTPFVGSTMQILLQHINNQPLSPSEIDSSIPFEVSAVILKALEKLPEKRFASVEELKEAYQQALLACTPPNLNRARSLKDTDLTEVLSPSPTTPLIRTNQDKLSQSPIPKISPPPSGTLHFLFTDIEGSTKLWEHHPEAMKKALARHDLLLREAIESHGGYVFKMIGDAFQAVFLDAREALKASVAGQLALRNEKWEPEIGELKVRMGLHTCQAENRLNDFVSPGLNRLARLLSVTYGGQVLLSNALAELVLDRLPEKITLKDLGERRLKDLLRPERIYQVMGEQLPADFPPLKTLERLPTNLPTQLNNLVGRQEELVQIKRLLQNSQLLTLTGAGGTGKTRLALEAAAQQLENYPGGVWFVELGSISDPVLIEPALATVLGVKEEANRPLLTAIIEYLKPRRILLLLDNCEHLVEACARLSQKLIQSCPQLAILVTSRESLSINGETSWRVPSLSLPPQAEWSDSNRLPPLEKLNQYESVQLFIERARAVNPNFQVTNQNAPALAQLCYELDGIPLALELAAARIRALSVEQIFTRLDNRFRLLTGNNRSVLPRQQTLRALIDWSYELLAENERVLFARLAVFAGGWTLEAGEVVCAGEYDWGGAANSIEDFEVMDLIFQLVSKSLVVAEEQGSETRYRLLETIRQYAREKLEASGETSQIKERHGEFYLKLAEDAEPELVGAQQQGWLTRIAVEHDNLLTALEWALQKPEGGEIALRLSGALGQFWRVRGLLQEGRRRLEAALALPGAPSPARLKALIMVGILARNQGDNSPAQQFWEEGLALAQQYNDKFSVARLLNNLGILARHRQDYILARSLQEESLARFKELGEIRFASALLNNLGLLARDQGDYAVARQFLEEALANYRHLKDKTNTAFVLASLGDVVLDQADFPATYRFLKECLAISQELGNKVYTAYSLEYLAGLAAALDQPEVATQLFGAARAMRDLLNSKLQPGEAIIMERRLKPVREEFGEENWNRLLQSAYKSTPEEVAALVDQLEPKPA